MLKKIFAGSSKYFILLFVTVVLIVLSGVLSPVLIKNRESVWPENLNDRLAKIEGEVRQRFAETEEKLKDKFTSISEELRKTNSDSLRGKKDIVNILRQKSQGYFNSFLLTGREAYAWSDNPDIFIPDSFSLSGASFFHNNGLVVSLSMARKVKTAGRNLLLVVNYQVEKLYHLENTFYHPISIIEEFGERYHTDFVINFEYPFEKELDGRFHSFYLYNSAGTKIASISFIKPTLNAEIETLDESISTFQSVLSLIGVILLGLGFYEDFMKIKLRLVKFLIIAVYITGIRLLMFEFELPVKFFDGGIADPSYFSSMFLFGTVRSPLEFFITTISFLIIIAVGFRYIYRFNFAGKPNRGSYLTFIPVLLVSIFLFLVSLRGLGAALKSVLFDSSLEYFRDTLLIPGAPSFIMHLSVLILGFCLVTASICYIVIIFKSFPSKNKTSPLLFFLLLFILMQISGIVYDAFQEQPQGTPLIRIMHITITFLLAYPLVVQKKKNLLYPLYYLLASSIITVSLLNYYNSELERESLKKTALELTRPNENFMEFLIRETLISSFQEESVRKCFEETENFELTAFKLWSKSVLQREGLSSELNFISPEGEYMGGFGFRFPENYRGSWVDMDKNFDGIKIIKERISSTGNKIIRGIIPVTGRGRLSGFLDASVIYDVSSLDMDDIPAFLSMRKVFFSTAVDFEELKIFDFHDNELVNFHADINLNDEEKELLVAEEFNRDNEKWMLIPLNDELHRVYVLKTWEHDITRKIAVALAEKEVSLSLYNFFKIFLIHSIIIFAILFIISIFRFSKNLEIFASFRTKLLLAFLLVSIIPLMFFGLYLKNSTESKNEDAVIYKLGKRAVSLEEYINNYLSKNYLIDKSIFEKAAVDLGINFALYKGPRIVYSTQDRFYKIGLIPSYLNPEVYNELINSGSRESVVSEKIENYEFNSLYYKAVLGESEYIIKVSDVFNPIMLPFGGVEIDIFLFGSYSFVVIMIVIISALFANQISSPIRKLTQATKAVARGDLSLELNEKSRGEIGELIEGFNSMIYDLKKSQAQLAEIERETAWKQISRQVAHEIKNPLTPMKLAVQQLIISYKDKSPKFDDIFEKVTNTVINQIETLKNIASEFSNFARMPSLKLEKFAVDHALADTVNLFMEEKVSIKLLLHKKEIMVTSDKDQVMRTLINLVRNSIQAGAENIEIATSDEENNVLIRVIDDGAGINPEIKNDIFKDNFTTKTKGMGLGLSMAKRFFESIHGSISVENTSPEGTTMLLKIPENI